MQRHICEQFGKWNGSESNLQPFGPGHRYLDSQLANHVPAEGVVTDHHPTQIPHNGGMLLTTRY